MEDFNDYLGNDITQERDDIYNVQGGYNLPKSEHKRASYEYSQGLINHIEQELAERQGVPYEKTFKRAREWVKKPKPDRKAKNPYVSTEKGIKESCTDIYTILKAYSAQDILFGQNWLLFRISTGSKVLTIRKLLPDGIEARVGWRYIFWSCKSALEAISSNMATTEEVFLQDTVIRLSNNSYSTIGEAAKKAFLALAP